MTCDNRTDEVEYSVIDAVAGLGEEVVILHRLPSDGAMRPRSRVGADAWQTLQQSRFHAIEVRAVVHLLKTRLIGVVFLQQLYGHGPVIVFDADVEQLAFKNDPYVAAKPFVLLDTLKARIAARKVLHEALQHILRLVRAAFVIEEPVAAGHLFGAEVFLEDGILTVILAAKHGGIVVVDIEQALIRAAYTNIAFSHFYVSFFISRFYEAELVESARQFALLRQGGKSLPVAVGIPINIVDFHSETH